MNRIKKYIMSKGYDVCEPSIGWRMCCGKHPLDCGAVYNEGQHVDSERAVQFEYGNTLGWQAHLFMRDGSVKYMWEDNEEWAQLMSGMPIDKILFLRDRPKYMRTQENGYAVMYGGFFGWTVDLLDCTITGATKRFRALKKAMPDLKLCVVSSNGIVITKTDNAKEYRRSYTADDFAREINRWRNLLIERAE